MPSELTPPKSKKYRRKQQSDFEYQCIYAKTYTRNIERLTIEIKVALLKIFKKIRKRLIERLCVLSFD